MAKNKEQQTDMTEEQSNNKGLLIKKKNDQEESTKNSSRGVWQNVAIGSGSIVILVIAAIAYFVGYKGEAFVQDVSESRILAQEFISDLDDLLQTNNKVEIKRVYSDLNANKVAMNERMDAVVEHKKSNQNVQEAMKLWLDSDKNLKIVLDNQKSLLEVNEQGQSIINDIPLIQKQYDSIVSGMLKSRSYSATQIVQVKNQIIISERILNSVKSIVNNNKLDLDTGQNFNEETMKFGAVLRGQLNGNAQLGITGVSDVAIRAKLDKINDIYSNSLLPNVAKIYENAQSLTAIRKNIESVRSNNKKLIKKLIETSRSKNWFSLIGSIVLVFSSIAFIYAIFMLMKSRKGEEQERALVERSRQMQETESEMLRSARIQEENDRNQSAILRLLDELGDLADGDLTVNATVSEDFTGAIADSVNFAIDQLRQLVSAINRTAISISGSSEHTQSTAMSLAESSEHQAQEIAGASAAINEMAVSIDQVSANAVESATVADRSVAIAYNGAEVVQKTIDGMNMIREQIQETSKRIKRLGESSQEIGDIISLINDIADQTNILALNAAIQASSAGEAGRGFAVVADEVQRLAERSANATKQIESLVKTIQADTNEAVASMELTTAEVVKGAKLAKDAGEALEEVQTVSNTLADLIQNISNAARQQAASAGHISNTMNIIQEITTQTTAGTIATARSVGQLNEMSIDLKKSVSDFKLPDDEAVSLV